MQYYPNQRFRPTAPSNAKHLGDQVLGDQRLQKARDAARKLRGHVDGARHKLKKLIDELEHLKHERHEDEHKAEAGEKLDHLVHEIEKVAHETHTELSHNPATHLPEYHHGTHGPEAGLFQLVSLLIIVLKRIQQMRSHAHKKLGKKNGEEAKRLLNAVKAEAKKR